MKILCGGDLHIRVTNPEFRVDDFVGTQKKKMIWLLELAREEKCELVLFPGDITDHSRLPYHIVDYYIRLFKSYRELGIYAVVGQHDMLYHVESQNTPISVMDASEAIFIVKGNYLVDTFDAPSGDILISGVSWDQEIPDPADDIINILLIHKMFVDEKLWEGQEEYERANIFLSKTKWDLIVSGDNHQHFMFQSRGRFHVNCGSLMRQNIDQIHHKPVVYIYDTEDRTLEPHYVPIDPPEMVFDIERARSRKEKDEKLEAFVEKIKEDTEIVGLDFVKNLDERLAKDDISEDIRELAEEVMRNAYSRIKH